MKNKPIGLFLPSIHKTGRHEYINELCLLAHENGYNTMCFSSYTDLYAGDKFDKGEASIYSLALNANFAAMVIFTELIKDDSVNQMLIKHAKKHHIPVFTIDKNYEGTYFIDYEYESTFSRIVSHVIEAHGAKNIYMISGIKDNSFSQSRNLAYRHALEAHGIEFDESKIHYGEFWDLPTQRAVNEILSSAKTLPDAIVCANDVMAITACCELEKHGIKVPEDVIVTGFDGIERARNNSPTITTAECDYKSTCRYIMDVIMSIDGGAEINPHRENFGFMITKGQSCGCCGKTDVFASNLSAKLHRIITTRDEHRQRMTHMTLLYNDGRGLKEALEAIGEYVRSVLYTGMEIYLDPEFFGNPCGMNCKKILAARVEPQTTIYSVPFTQASKSELCTDEVLEDSGNVLFVPIHRQDNVYGYLVTEYSCTDIEAGERLYEFVTHLNFLFSSIENTAKLNEMVKMLNDMYIRDPLTNLLNRRGFYREIDQLTAIARRHGDNVLIISADLDGLKYINDTYGHFEGDYAIKAIADILIEITGECGICARFGGDEYLAAIICTAKLKDFEKEFYDKINKLNKIANKPYPINASLGYEKVTAEEVAQSLQEIIKRTDNKMFEKKSRSKYSRKPIYGKNEQ